MSSGRVPAKVVLPDCDNASNFSTGLPPRAVWSTRGLDFAMIDYRMLKHNWPCSGYGLG